MADIARRTGVSLSTVSYALSGKRTISEPTRRRVLEAMAELDFQPHALGRALASKRTKTVALLFPALAKGLSETRLEFVTNAAETAGEHGYSLLLSTSPADDAEVVRLVRGGLVDGLILMEIKLRDSRVEVLRASGYPFVLIGHCQRNDGISFVDLDFDHAVGLAVRHLAALGHRRIGFINASAPLYEAGYGPAVRSLAGFRRAVAEGITGHAHACEPTHEAGYMLTQELLTAHPDLTALVTINREALGGIVQAAHDGQRRIPDDLSLVAVVSERLARLFTPALTTIDFPDATMGRMGAELLVRQLEGGAAEPTHCLLRAELSVRGSTGPPRDG
jgi:DNA-binding LacI/PurR family transcriptional regulator